MKLPEPQEKLPFNHSHTVCIIKPDAFQRQVSITQRLLQEKFLVVRDFHFRFSRHEAEWFYEEHKGKPFFQPHIDFITSGPCVFLFLWRQTEACGTLRELLGNTNPDLAAPETLRRLYGSGLPENALHGSDNLESVNRETRFFLSGRELLQLV
jgi:nucleoside-diphosphate kinase